MPQQDITRRDFNRIVVSVPALAAFLSACGGPKEEGPLGGVGGPALSVATQQSPWLPSYQKIVDVYREETGRNVNLRIFTFAGLLTQQINAIKNRSNAFDVFQVNEGWTGQFYNNGWLIPLREVDPDFEWDPQLIDYAGVGQWDKARRTTSPDGEPMGLPMNGNILLLFYRKDVYDKLGLAVPETFDAAIAAGKRAQAERLVRYGYAIRAKGDIGGYANTFNFGPVLHGYGGDWFVKPGEDWTPAIDNEAGQAAMEKWLEMGTLGPAQPQSIGQTEMQALMQSGQALQIESVNASAPAMDDPSSSRVVGKVDYAVVPAGGAGMRAAMAGTWVSGIPVGLPKDRQQAALEFITWLMSKQAQMRWAEFGGIVTRKDVYASSLAEKPENRYMKATNASTPHLHPGIRFPFSQPFLVVTERRITEIMSRQLSVKRGLKLIADEIGKTAAEAGFR